MADEKKRLARLVKSASKALGLRKSEEKRGDVNTGEKGQGGTNLTPTY